MDRSWTSISKPNSMHCKFSDQAKSMSFESTVRIRQLRQRYGDNDFGRAMLMARRLVEAGVPFVEVNLPGWDVPKKTTLLIYAKTFCLSSTVDCQPWCMT